MPTENRSSNTQMAAQLSPCPHCGQQDAFVEQLDSDASVVICQGRIDEHSACLARGPVGVQQHECEDQPGYDQAVKEWNKRAAAVPHPDPIAWMVGTAFWWTKEEAERDAAATGLPMIPVGPMTGAGDIGLAREMLRRALRREDKWAFLCSGRSKQIAELRARLAELPERLISAIEREQERCSQDDYLMDSDDCIKVIREALADSGVPVPPDQPYQGIPGTSFRRLNALANQGE